MSTPTEELELEHESTDEEVDAYEEVDVGAISFFAEADQAAAVFGERIVDGTCLLTSPLEARICDRVNRIFKRELFEKGLITKDDTRTERRSKSEFAPLEQDQPTVEDREEQPQTEETKMPRKSNAPETAAAYKRLETELGHAPTAQEYAKHVGVTRSGAVNAIARARQKGLLPAMPPGPRAGTSSKPRSSATRARANPAPTSERAVEPPRGTPAGTLASAEFLDALRFELERVEAWREKLQALLGSVGA